MSVLVPQNRFGKESVVFRFISKFIIFSLLFKLENRIQMKKLAEKKNYFLRKLFGALSLTSALFVFQACYGTPQDFGQDVVLEGLVTSKNTQLPLSGVKVSIADSPQYEITDENGHFKIYTTKEQQYLLQFGGTVGSQMQTVTGDTLVGPVDRLVFLKIGLDVE